MTASRIQRIKRVSWIAIIGNALLAFLKVSAGIHAGSLAVVGDGIDSSTDIVTSLITLFAAQIISMPPDREHPYGHSRAETIATTLLSFVIFFAGIQLFISTVSKLINGHVAEVPGILAVYATVISVFGKIFLAVILFRAGKKNESSMLIANGKNMKSDILISLSVLTGLVCTFLSNLPILDTVIALLISLWIIKTAVEVFIDINHELMEGFSDPSVYDKIFTAVGGVDGASNPHRTRVRNLSNMYVIDIDIEVDPELTVFEAHKIAVEVERSISESIENVYDIVVHIEPHGNVEEDEKYGLNSGDIE